MKGNEIWERKRWKKRRNRSGRSLRRGDFGVGGVDCDGLGVSQRERLYNELSWVSRLVSGVGGLVSDLLRRPLRDGRRRLRDLATSFLFSAALFPVVWGGTILGLTPEGGGALALFFGPALLYGVWFWARLRRPARRETLRRYRGRLVATFVWATFLETALRLGCAVSAGGGWAFLTAVPVIAVLWAAVVFFCAAFEGDEKKPNAATGAGDAEAAFDGTDDADGGDGD